jgi:hypothetical protein
LGGAAGAGGEGLILGVFSLGSGFDHRVSL